MKKIIIFHIFILCLCVSCAKLFTYKKFQLTKTPYTGNELRTDGYYYRYYECDIGSNCIASMCYYKNGISLNMGGGALSLIETDNYIRKYYVEGERNPDYNWLKWGLFDIEGQTIKFEHYYPTDALTRWTYICEGTILNDTSFHITEIYRSDGKGREKIDDYYYFRPFSPKPDSINNIIK